VETDFQDGERRGGGGSASEEDLYYFIVLRGRLRCLPMRGGCSGSDYRLHQKLPPLCALRRKGVRRFRGKRREEEKAIQPHLDLGKRALWIWHKKCGIDRIGQPKKKASRPKKGLDGAVRCESDGQTKMRLVTCVTQGSKKKEYATRGKENIGGRMQLGEGEEAPRADVKKAKIKNVAALKEKGE